MAAVETPTNLTKIIELFTDIGLKIIPFLGAVAFVLAMWCIDEAECPSTSASKSMRLWSGRGSGVERMTRWHAT